MEELLSRLDELENRLAALQLNDSLTDENVKEARDDYGKWYAEAKSIIPAEQRDRFQDMYEGGSFIKRIQSYLADPRSPNQFYDDSLESNPFVSRWQIPFTDTVRDSIAAQRQILMDVLYSEPVSEVISILDQLTVYFARIPEYLATLRAAGSQNVPEPRILAERDLQVLVHSHLRMLYQDIRAEDYVPQYAGGSSRVDFLIKDFGVIVETKMTRSSLLDKKVGEELLIDWGRYSQHPACLAIFALVYDPERLLVNPEGLAADLSQTGPVPTRVIVVR